jgi:serine/threonine-protein kinase
MMMAHPLDRAGPRAVSPLPPAYAAVDLLSGRYRLVSLLGEGGMGTVWRAHSLSLERDVALKLIRSDRESAEAVARLRLEAHAASAIEHPSIVRVFDLGETALGDPFLVMELLQGESLADLIDHGGPMREPRAVALMLPLAAALQAAHEKGIVHRDVKPDNIFIVPLDRDEGTRLPKIVDFGLARLEASQRRLTAEGSVLGSPGYMAPEQAMGERDVDARADVWGFCIVLYELITGLVPFSGANVGQTIAAIVQLDPRSTTDLVGGDPDLWAILRRGLAKAREDRFPTMAALRSALIAWAAAHGVTADITGAPLAGSSRSDRATPVVPASLDLADWIEPTELAPTLVAPRLDVDPPRRASSAGLATPARRINATTSAVGAPRSPALLVILAIAVALLVALGVRRAVHAPPSGGPAGSSAP